MTAVNLVRHTGLEYLYGGGEPTPMFVQMLASDANIVGTNDPLKFATLASGLKTMTRCSATDDIHAICIQPRVKGWQYTDSDRRRQASVLTTLLVIPTNASQIYRIQSDGITAFSATLANKYCALATVGNADSVTAVSTVTADLSTAAASPSATPLYILGLDDTYGDLNLAAINATLQVKIVNSSAVRV